MISILIPIYNGIEFIDESVNSVLNQTYTEWELIIAINGHPENSKVYQVANKYVEKSDKIRVFDFWVIKGKSNTLNECLKYCNGDYIALLDVDDIWYKNKLKIQSKKLRKYDVIGTKCIYFGDLNNIIPFIPFGDISKFNFLEVNPVINSSAIIKKELCWWDENGIEDYDLWLKLWKQKKKFYNFKNILVKHRIHKESAFNSKGHNLKVKDLLLKYK
jgi:glycosyltransferase involved in cell wall biosynthesis